jgi:peptidoglycan hydrolase-like protein with peptidoglycan-binding domain
VMVRKMVAPERQTVIEIPAEYGTVSRQVVKSPATTEWREVLCDNNATPAKLTAIQQSLRKAGFDPGREDGKVDPKVMSAVRAFQQAKGLPQDGGRYINMATVKALGVTP